MQFNSIQFLFYFLTLFLAVYYIIPESLCAFFLTMGSLFFYWLACGRTLWCTAVLAGLTVLTYLWGLLLGRFPRRWLLAVSVVLLAGGLLFFKCYDGGRLLPVGMSFFVFQMIAYLADVCRKRLPAERSFFSYTAQTTMFPKLLSGPLVEPAKLRLQAQTPCRCVRHLHLGLQELILGLGLKVLLADRVGGIWAQARVVGYESISTPFAWLALLSFSMRLYFDFYGYSLMAVGLGHMLGYHLPMNFLEPYSAKSVSDFYRRWHATLGRWFRDYVYIPLGGSRRGMGRTVCNLALVWLITGLWHGVDAGYLIWAGWLFLLVVLEHLWLKKWLDRSRVLCHVYTIGVILLSWAPFAAGSWGNTVAFLSRLFGIGPGLGSGRDYLVWGREYAPLLAAGVLFATPYPKRVWEKVRSIPATDVVLFLLFWIVVYVIATSAQDPFFYFKY